MSHSLNSMKESRDQYKGNSMGFRFCWIGFRVSLGSKLIGGGSIGNYMEKHYRGS